jgi:hypothetical protein
MQEVKYDYKNYNYSQNMNLKEQSSYYYSRQQRRGEQHYYENPYINEEEEECNLQVDQPLLVSKTRFKGDRQELQQENKTEETPLRKILESVFEQEKACRNLEMEIKLVELQKEMLINSLDKSIKH